MLEYTRLIRNGGVFVQYGLRQFKEQQLALVDSNFFHVFTLPFLEGDAGTALTQPHSIVVTRAFADKYFGAGSGSAIGKTLSMGRDSICTVTGVIDNLPDNTHFHFDALSVSAPSPSRSKIGAMSGPIPTCCWMRRLIPNGSKANFPSW